MRSKNFTIVLLDSMAIFLYIEEGSLRDGIAEMESWHSGGEGEKHLSSGP